MNQELGEIIQRIDALLANIESPEEERQALCTILEAIKRHRPDVELEERNGVPSYPTLDESERRLLCLTVAGMANKIIAREFDISVRSVFMRRAALMKKLGASNRAELVRMAVQAGLCN